MAKKSNYKNRYQIDNMTPQQKDSAVKKINERYTDICRTFGPNSNTAQEYFNAMVLAFGAENMHTAATRESKAKICLRIDPAETFRHYLTVIQPARS